MKKRGLGTLASRTPSVFVCRTFPVGVNIVIILTVMAVSTATTSASLTGSHSAQQQQATDNNCPSYCQCPREFYVYCQAAGLRDHHVTDIVSQISPSAVLLDMSDNQITSLQPEAFKRLSNLQYLFLSSNRLKEIPPKAFRCLLKLKRLTLDKNNISSISSDSFFDLVRIQSLHLNHNNISSLPLNVFSNLKTLGKLHLQQNSFAELKTGMFSGLDNLESLNISHNSDLSFIQNNAFSGLSKLRSLDLGYNSLSELSTSTFKGLAALHELDLQRNFISNVTFLESTGSPQTASAEVGFQHTLTSVSLAGNRLETIPSHVFPLLTSLSCLDLSHNSLASLKPGTFSTLLLSKLSLRGNNLTELGRGVFAGARRISELDLAQNHIAGLVPGVFDSFRQSSTFSVDLSDNRVTYIYEGIFREMRGLRLLNLSGNSISVIEPGALDDLELLEVLDLSRNRLTSVTPEMVSGPGQALRKLRLVGNPLKQIRGFSFFHEDDQITIEAEARVLTSSATSAQVTWPYTAGSQLYWSLTVTCGSLGSSLLPSSSMSSSSSSSTTLTNSKAKDPPLSALTPANNISTSELSHLQCGPPVHDSVLEPFRQQGVIQGLRPDTHYTVCVTPVFVSPKVVVIQCAPLRTNRLEGPVTPDSKSGRVSPSNSASSWTFCVSSSWVWGTLLVITFLGLS